MNIAPINNNDISMKGNPFNWIKNQTKRGIQKVFDVIPEHTEKENSRILKNMGKVDEWISHPMWNRGIMGATALLSQPAIDYYNHRVDDETRTVSRNRTIAKIVAGTLVGMFVVRGPMHKAVKAMTNVTGKEWFSKLLLPKKYIPELANPNNTTYLKNYRTTLSMLLALFAMTYTNFKLDAPFTIFLTNKFNEKSGVKKAENTGEEVKHA